MAKLISTMVASINTSHEKALQYSITSGTGIKADVSHGSEATFFRLLSQKAT